MRPTASAVTAEMCPECGSLDVRVVERHWFAVDLDRRSEFEPPGPESVEGIEFGCRECGAAWD